MKTTEAPSASTVNAIARKWAALYPEYADRIMRAVALVANVVPGDRSNRVFFVEGSAGRRYMIMVDWAARTSSCTCPDSDEHSMHCKHRWAAALFVAAHKADKAARQPSLF